MAEKKTTAKKKATKKAKDNKVIKEVAESIINESKVLGPVEPSEEEFKEAAKAAAEEILKQAEEDEPIIVGQDPPIEEVEVMNGDPSVVIPSNEIEINKDLTLEIEKKAFRDTFKELNNENKPKIDRSFGYSWNGMEMDY